MSTRGPAYEIRFCDNEKVQVFDLSQRSQKAAQQPLPCEYQEDDVRQGRLRYSKLGNQWIADDRGFGFADTSSGPIESNPLDVIPMVAKQKRLDDAKEQERIREGEEAVRKAMERKERIALAKLNRDRRMAEEQAAAAVTTATFSSVLSGSSDSDTHSMQDSSPRVPEAAKIRHSSRMTSDSRRSSTGKRAIMQDGTAPSTPTPRPANHASASSASSSSFPMHSAPAQAPPKAPPQAKNSLSPPPDSSSPYPMTHQISPYHASPAPQVSAPYYSPPPAMVTTSKHQQRLHHDDPSFFHQDLDEKPPSSSSFCCC